MINKIRARGLLITMLLFAGISSALAAAQDPLQLSPGFNQLQPREHLYIFRDLSETKTIQDVMALPDSAFSQQQQQTPNYGLDNSGHFWIRSSISSPRDLQVFAELAFPTLREVSFYAVID
ncbi:MAG: 7TM-DISM domain-containing protein, partial [Ketobacteraceae bacterium]|nr:7TM-DISM domain-containing protein [Ketobacteraceae bacterium]